MIDALRVFEDDAEMIRQAAAEVARLAARAAARRGRFSVALAGGHTPKPLYEALARDHRDAIPWDLVHVFWGDERFVPHDDPRSNFRMAREALLSRVPIPSDQIHPMPTEGLSPGEAARDYEKTLRRHFEGSWPRLDLALLGLGADGHTASLFPGAPALHERRRWVAEALAPDEPRQRLTLTFPVFNHAGHVHFIAGGAGKAEALRCALDPEARPERCPAAGIRPAHGNRVWWLDRAIVRSLPG
ncbi:6-phosphogluconolactonase [Rhodocaloribacter sp.]